MKKIKISLLLFIFLVSFTFINVYASDVNYDIKGLYIDAHVDIAGSMDVSELIVMKGTFNGYKRDVLIKGNGASWKPGKIDFEQSSIYDGYSIENVKISAKYIDSYKDASLDMIKDKDFDAFKKVNVASIGDSKKYELTKNNNGESYKMYYPSSSDTVAFLVQYTVSNVVVVHNDVNELYWNFIGKGFIDDLSNVEIRVILPFCDDSDDFKFWAHGSLEGEIYSVVDKDDKNLGVLASIPKIKKNDPVDIRMTFNKDVLKVTDFLNHSEEDALPSILKVEKVRADKANRDRAIAKAVNNVVLGFDIVYVLGVVGLFIFLYFKYDKEYKAAFNQEYYRDFLDNYEPEELSYLLNHMVDDNAFSASFMNLIYKHNVEIESPCGTNDYVFRIKNRDTLSEAETILVELLFDKVGNGEIFTLATLKKYTKSQKTALIFSAAYNKWKSRVYSNVNNHHVYEDFASARIIALLVGVIGFVLMIMSICFEVHIPFSIFNIILSIGFVLYVCLFTRRTNLGNEDYHKAKAIKKFLLDFGAFKEKELPEIKLWDKYLIYATAFGIASRVEKSMTKCLKNMNIDPNSTVSGVYPSNIIFLNSSINNSISTGISSSISSAVSSSIASSVAASSSGSGGGFSSGGGCGGGGGGGGGF